MAALAIAGGLFLSLPAMAVAQQPAKPRPGDSILPQALLDQHAADPLCSPLDELVHSGDRQVHQLGEGISLYMIPCMAGAYNFSHALYLSNPFSESFQRLLFVDFNDRYGWMGADQLVGAAFDPATLTLTSFYKGRGLADCGTSGIWVWDQYAFRLEAFHAQSECDGTIEPDDFPQVWPN